MHILTFNWHDPYIYLFAQTGCDIHVCDWMQRADGTRGWDLQKRPVPPNLTLIKEPSEAIEQLSAGAFDLALAHTLQDIAFLERFDVPAIYLTHNALQNDGRNNPRAMGEIRSTVEAFLAARRGVFAAISPMKLGSWGLDGLIVRPGIPLSDYEGYDGTEAAALSVGNLFVERDFMLGYSAISQALEGLPHTLVGENASLPAARKADSWDALKAFYRSHRVYVNGTVETFEDGYNLATLEAMATGMPVATMANASSPIEDGVNGFICETPETLRDRVTQLLEDAELAKALGARARQTVSEAFSVDAFVSAWHDIFNACLDSASPAPVNAAIDLETRRDDLFPYTADDVRIFLTTVDLDGVTISRIKLDRIGNGHLCDVSLFEAEARQTVAWQGIEATQDGAIRWPTYLMHVPPGIKGLVENAIRQTADAVRQDPRMAQTPTVVVTLNECEEAVYRVGEDRVTPGDARSDIYLHHAKRYAFASQFCENRRVVEIGGGTGYGARILSRHARYVVCVDLSKEAMHYGNRTFGKEGVSRISSDGLTIGLSAGQFDAAVCFEMIEHITEHNALLDEVRRLLTPDGVFVVSTPNKMIYDLPVNENTFHVGMLTLPDFEALMRSHFDEVEIVAQRRARPDEPFYDAFGFDAHPTDGHEVFIAICCKPRQISDASASRVVVRDVEPAQTAAVATEEPAKLRVLFSHVSNPISAGRYYVDAFSRYCDVITCGPMIDDEELRSWREAEREHAFKSLEDAEHDKLARIGDLAVPCDIPTPRGRVDIGHVIDALPDGWRPDLFVWADSATGFLPVGLEKLRCPTTCLVGDTHTGQMDWRIDYARMFTHTFVMFNRQHVPHFHRGGVANVAWLPGACDPAFHGPGDGEIQKCFDIGFAGQTHRQWHPERVRLLQRMMDAGLDVRVESKILDEMGQFFGQSRIVFNRSLNDDLNMRVFEALCSGSLLLTDRLAPESGIEDLFADRKQLVLYNEADLEDLAHHYLNEEEEREAIADAGRQAVLDAHTYDHRVVQILEAIEQSEAPALTPTAPKEVQAPQTDERRDIAIDDRRSTIDPVEELATYTDSSVHDVEQQMARAGQDLADVWRQRERTTADQINAFYKDTDRYLYDLTAFNYGPMYTGWRGVIYNLCQQVSEQVGPRGFDVLDFGGGIGSTLIDIADLPGARLTYADLSGPTFDYAEWRFARREIAVQTVDVTDPDVLDGRQFDIIVCLDALEHLPDPEAALARLVKHLRPGGLLILTVTFYTNEQGPFHLNCGKYTNESFYEIVASHGMTELSRFSPRVFQKAVSEPAVPGRRAESGPAFSSKEQVDVFLARWADDIRLNLGCGADRRPGYINVDAYVEDADLKLDIFALPLENETVDEIYSSHMLEHLGKHEVPKALAEWHRVLKDGGKLTLNLPDLEWIARHWLEQPEDTRWGWALDAIYGLQSHDGEHHKTGFTAERVELLLADAGFRNIVVSWTWSHGVRCVWAEAVRAEAGEAVDRSLESRRLSTQFTTDYSELFPYTSEDVVAFLEGDAWRFGFVAFEHLTADGAVRGVSVAIKRGDRQMVLQGLRVAQDTLSFPSYLDALADEQRSKIEERVGSSLQTVKASPEHKDDRFVFARFGEDGDLGLEKTGERVIPGLTELSLYIPHVKRYLLAQSFADGKRVLDAGCGAGYGSKLMANVATSVDAVDIDPEAVAFCKKTFADQIISWQVGDLRAFTPEQGVYDLVTSFEVIEHLTHEEIPEYLCRIRSALKPDGVALISTPNRLVAEQWQNSFHHAEMTLEEFKDSLTSEFEVAAILGQAQWSPHTELQGQCAISRRLTDADDMFIAVCRPLPTAHPRGGDRAPFDSAAQDRQGSTGDLLSPASVEAKVDVVIPLYNKADYTRACLEGMAAIKEATRYQVILIDNASTDGTPDLMAEWADRADGFRSEENLGFAAGNNLGARRGQAPYILFLNNDTVPEAGWLDAMVHEMESDSTIGIVGAKLLYPDKRDIQHAGLEIINGVPDHVFRYAPEGDPGANQVRDLDMVTGACLMIRRELFETLDGFDEAYVNGVEDIDLCLRARDRGFRVRYCPASVLIHHEGTSEGRYNHVQPNLAKFAQRFQGRFDGRGKFVPVLDKPAGVKHGNDETPLIGVWEGTQLVHHSLSIVNTSVASALIRRGDIDLKLVPYEPAQFGPEADPDALGPVAARINAELSGTPQFHVRHKWPPDFASPPSGHWVMIQPWEFGSIPKAWVEPIQSKVDEIWVPSQYSKGCYVDSGIDAERVCVIPNGVDPNRFQPNSKSIDLPTSKAFKFLFVGGTIYRKGIDILLETYRSTFTADDDVCLVIKGAGDDSFYKGQSAADLIRNIQDDPQAPEVIYLTDDLSDDQIVGLYTACDCLVHPYRGEGFGMPVAEAMGCGLPVIVTAGGATDDFCTDETSYRVRATRTPIAFQEETAGQTWLLDPDRDHLVEQMKAVVAEPDEAATVGARASAFVRENLTWDVVADLVVKRLRDLRQKPIRRGDAIVGPVISPDDVDAVEPDAQAIEILTFPGPDTNAEWASHALETRTSCPIVLRDSEWPEDRPAPVGALLNRVLGEITSQFVVLLRSDVVVTEGWLDRLLAPLRAVDDIVAAIPAVPVGPEGQQVRSQYQSLKKELSRFARQQSKKASEPFEATSASAACVVIQTSALKAMGGFEETMETEAFIDDLLRRFRLSGKRVLCIPAAYVHVEGRDPIPLDEAGERRAIRCLREGDDLRREGDQEAALFRYQEALELKPDYVEAALVASAVLLELDRPLEAAEPFRVLEQKFPASSRVKNYLGRCLFRAGKVDEARSFLAKAIELNPDFAEALGNLGVLMWESGELDAAVETLGRAAEIAPDDPDIVFNVGMVYSQLGQSKEAARVLEHFLVLEPENLDARVHLAVLKIDHGDVEGGVLNLETVLAVDPEHADALRVVNDLQTILDGAASDDFQGP